MEISAPTFRASEKSYSFPIVSSTLSVTSTAQYLEGMTFPDSPDVTGEQFQQTLTDFLNTFIEKTKKHFATPLRSKTILSRLNHVWEGNMPAKPIDPPGWYTVSWMPRELKIMPREFVLVWKSQGLVPSEPVIPSEFVVDSDSRCPSPAPELRTIHVQSTPSNGLIEHEPAFSETADPRMMTLDYEAPGHTLEKKRIREAKLRAALASLKAERLAEKYYQKYGNLPGDDSSDLTSDSEVEES